MGNLAALAKERRINESVLKTAGIYVEDEGRYEGWFAIPYPHRSGQWKIRYRNPDPGARPKYLDGPGATFHLYNPLLLGPGEDEVWITEGEFDTLALIDQGFPAIGIHGASNIAQKPQKGEEEDEVDEDEESTGRWHRSWNLLFEDTDTFVIFDNDEAGRYPGRKLARALNGTAFDNWDDEYGDVNEWHAADPSGLARALYEFRSGHTRSHRVA